MLLCAFEVRIGALWTNASEWMEIMKKEKIIIIATVLMMGLLIFSSKAYASENTEPDYYKLAEQLMEEMKNGNLSSKEDILNALNEAEERYNVDISENDEEKIADALNAVDSIGLDKEKLADMAGEVYSSVIKGKTYENTSELIDAVESKIKDEIADKVKETVKETVSNSIFDCVGTFFKKMQEFASGISNLWKS